MDGLSVIYPTIVDAYTQEQVNALLAGYVTAYTLSSVSGILVAQIPSLSGYATQSWSNAAFITPAALTTASAALAAQILSSLGYATQTWVSGQAYTTEAQLTTTSANIISQLPNLVNYVTNTQLTTVSANLVSQIPSLTGYATQSGVTAAGYITSAQLTTVSATLASQIPSLVDYATQAWASSQFITPAILTTTSANLVAQMGAGGITLAQLTAVSGNIVSQIPSLSGYATQAWITDQGYTTTLSGINGISTTLSGGIWYVNPSSISASHISYSPPTGAALADGITNASTVYATPAMTSEVLPSPCAVSASTEYSGWPAWQAFNQDGQTTGWGSNNETYPWLQFDFGAANPVIINKYNVMARGLGNTPTGWTLKGSNDGVVFTALHTVATPAWNGTTYWCTAYQTFTNSIAYRYYRLVFTNVGYVNVMEVQLVAAQLTGAWAGPTINTVSDALTWLDPIVYNLSQVSGTFATQSYVQTQVTSISGTLTSAGGGAWSPSAYIAYIGDGSTNASTAYATAAMASNTTPAPNAVSYSSFYSSSYDGWMAFNQDGTASWWTSAGAGMPQWIQLDLGPSGAVVVNKYAVAQQPGYHIPSAWILRGSNDGVSFTDLHTVSSASFSGNWTPYYTFVNITAYRYYRLYVTSSSDGYVSIAELRLVPASSGLVSWYSGPTITTVSGALDWMGPIVYSYAAVSGSYATQAWVAAQTYVTWTQLITTSGSLVAQMPSLAGYATQAYVQAQIATVSGGGGGTSSGTVSSTPQVLVGPQSLRPTATTSGRIYMPTDGYYPSVDNGSAWSPNLNGFQCVNPPAVGSITAVNQHYSTLASDGDGLLLTNMGSNSGADYTECYLVAVPAAPYRFIVGYNVMFLNTNPYTMLGIVCASSNISTGSMEYMSLCTNGSAAQTTIALQQYGNYAWHANITASNTGYTGFSCPLTIFMRFRDDGTTNRYYDISFDGRNFINIYSVARTNYFTPTYVGLHTNQQSTAVLTTNTRVLAKILHWYLGT